MNPRETKNDKQSGLDYYLSYLISGYLFICPLTAAS